MTAPGERNNTDDGQTSDKWSLFFTQKQNKKNNKQTLEQNHMRDDPTDTPILPGMTTESDEKRTKRSEQNTRNTKMMGNIHRGDRQHNDKKETEGHIWNSRENVTKDEQ